MTTLEDLIDELTELLRPCAIPPSPIQAIFQEAAKRAGWRAPSVRIQQRQRRAADGRKRQRAEESALRRVMVAIIFKRLPARLRNSPQSLGTAQAIIGRLEKLNVNLKHVTPRTIQADIRYLKDHHFGI